MVKHPTILKKYFVKILAPGRGVAQTHPSPPPSLDPPLYIQPQPRILLLILQGDQLYMNLKYRANDRQLE